LQSIFHHFYQKELFLVEISKHFSGKAWELKMLIFSFFLYHTIVLNKKPFQNKFDPLAARAIFVSLFFTIFE
jgi:hypothetical protein